MAVRLPVRWDLSCPLTSSAKLLSTCFMCNAQVKARYELESFGTYKQADSRSAANQREHNLFQSKTYHDGKRYWLVML